MFPRTLRCSTATGFLPFSVNLTCFRCVFMLTSTPARVEKKSIETHHRQSRARRERRSRASRQIRLIAPPRAVANSSRRRPTRSRVVRARRETERHATDDDDTSARVSSPSRAFSIARIASARSCSNRARTHDRPVRRRAILQLDRHALVGEFLKESHELHLTRGVSETVRPSPTRVARCTVARAEASAVGARTPSPSRSPITTHTYESRSVILGGLPRRVPVSSSVDIERRRATVRASLARLSRVSRAVSAMRVLSRPSLSRADASSIASRAPRTRVDARGWERNRQPRARASDDEASLDTRTVAEMEALYARAKDSYYDGAPVVSDEYFDALEAKLSYAGSAAVRKYPRCSVRGKAVYSDCVVDEGQMRALFASYVGIVALGAAFAVCDFGTALAESEGARAPVLGLAGCVLAKRGWDKLAQTMEGSTLAMTGECPACHEAVYAFLPTARGQAKERAECHVCGRKIVFETQFEPRLGSPWKVTGKGRVFLVAEVSDFRPG